MSLIRTVEPTVEPVTLTEVGTHCRVDDLSAEQEYLEELIAAARDVAEQDLERALLAQTWRWSLDAFPADRAVLHVPRPPLQAVTSIDYTDMAGQQQTVASGDYVVDTDALVGRIRLVNTATWPSTLNTLRAVQITFDAGWTDAASIPRSVRLGILQLIGTWYAHRESVVTGTIATKLPDVVERLFAPHRVRRF